mmetsp:Transcript_13674/g.50965  ORF Transcript_13674/g.50965 Transcript_13674/m.50965 type:complete len:204 (-) Transcript_13674:1448-2059(-)
MTSATPGPSPAQTPRPPRLVARSSRTAGSTQSGAACSEAASGAPPMPRPMGTAVFLDGAARSRGAMPHARRSRRRRLISDRLGRLASGRTFLDHQGVACSRQATTPRTCSRKCWGCSYLRRRRRTRCAPTRMAPSPRQTPRGSPEHRTPPASAPPTGELVPLARPRERRRRWHRRFWGGRGQRRVSGTPEVAKASREPREKVT